MLRNVLGLQNKNGLMNMTTSVLRTFWCGVVTKFTFVFSCVFTLLLWESDQSNITSSLRSCRPSVYHTKIGEPRQVPFPMIQVNLSICSPHCSFNTERQAGKLWISILKSLVWPDSKSNQSPQLQKQTLVPLGHRSCRLTNLQMML